MERNSTFILLEPETLGGQVEFEVLERFSDKGFRIPAMYMTEVSPEMAKEHYRALNGNDATDKRRVEHLASSPVIVAYLEGEEAVRNANSLIHGQNLPEKPPGTIRGDFLDDLVQEAKEGEASDLIVETPPNDQTAEYGLELWFERFLDGPAPSYTREEGEHSLVLLKPDAKVRGIEFDVLERVRDEVEGYDGLYTGQVDRTLLIDHYEEAIERVGSEIGRDIIEYMSASPVTAMSVYGENVIDRITQARGESWDPSKCSPGTIRHDFSLDSGSVADREGRTVHNIIHASDSPETAERELALWFGAYLQDNFDAMREHVRS